MPKFRKKPVVNDAVQFTEELRDAIVLDGAPVPDGLCLGARTFNRLRRQVYSADFYIKTPEGRMHVDIGDWIITGVAGEHYPCKDEIFRQTYEPAEE